uniref:Uncharacterized protein n=1 Tax=Tetradesmus obliquus TaxID=3088 RepID=A0A383VSI9_TETOB|eukprot:jgi/Sobl393_1/9755/SZX68488.1
MQKTSSCKAVLALLLAACLVMAAASRPLASSSSTTTLLDSSSTTPGTQALLQPAATSIPVRRLLAKPVNQAAQKTLAGLLKAAKVSSS